jgi:hypothetical protein
VVAAAALGEQVVEPDLARVPLEDHRRSPLVVDEVDGPGDAGVGDALEQRELPAGGPGVVARPSLEAARSTR